MRARAIATLAVLGLAAPAAAQAADTTGGMDPTGGASTTTSTTTTTTPSTAPTPDPSTTTTPAPSTTSTVLKLTSTQMKSLQRKLHIHADGKSGPKTRAAIKRAEKRLGLPVDGKPDAALLTALKVPVPGSTTAPTSPISATASSAAPAAVQAAMSRVGDPYVSAGDTPGGFDCSGLTMWAYKQAGVTLPHSSFSQYKMGAAVDQDSIQAGDLVFFDSAGPGASDVGIATGPDTVVSATTHGVMEHAIFDDYWGGHYVGARRLADQGSSAS
jgi:peptidoglycan DL-endopeptidase CwlO